MWLTHLEVEGLRNLEKVALDLDPRFNFFFGLNGAGKTSLLEAIHVLARGRSFRAQQVSDVIKTGEERLVVRAGCCDEHLGAPNLVLARDREGATTLRMDGQPVRKQSEVASRVPIAVFTPDTIDLIIGGPGVRRQWLDWGVFHVEHEHMANLRRYATAMRQRNACLRALDQGRAEPKALEPWTQELALLGEAINTARERALDSMAGSLSACLGALAPGLAIDISLRRGWPEGMSLREAMCASAPREVKSGATLVGPHRADVILRSGGQSCAVMLSRGQAKVAASAMVLAQADSIAAGGVRGGLFLIDDIGAELDQEHRARLFMALNQRELQVFATSVEPPEQGLIDHCTRYALFHVEQGEISPRV